MGSSGKEEYTALYMNDVKKRNLFHVRLNDEILEKLNKYMSSKLNSKATIQIKDGEMIIHFPNIANVTGTIVSEEKKHFCFEKEEYGLNGIGSIKNKVVIKSVGSAEPVTEVKKPVLSQKNVQQEPEKKIKVKKRNSNNLTQNPDSNDKVESNKKRKISEKFEDFEPLDYVYFDEKDLSQPTTIKNDKELKDKYELFQKLFPIYRQMFKVLEKNRDQLTKIMNSIDESSKSDSEIIEKLLLERDESIRKMNSQYKLAHTKLQELRQSIGSYMNKKL